jgi:hypothetical protein
MEGVILEVPSANLSNFAQVVWFSGDSSAFEDLGLFV